MILTAYNGILRRPVTFLEVGGALTLGEPHRVEGGGAEADRRAVDAVLQRAHQLG